MRTLFDLLLYCFCFLVTRLLLVFEDFHGEFHDPIRFALIKTLQLATKCTKIEMREYGTNDLIGCRYVTLVLTFLDSSASNAQKSNSNLARSRM